MEAVSEQMRNLRSTLHVRSRHLFEYGYEGCSETFCIQRAASASIAAAWSRPLASNPTIRSAPTSGGSISRAPNRMALAVAVPVPATSLKKALQPHDLRTPSQDVKHERLCAIVARSKLADPSDEGGIFIVSPKLEPITTGSRGTRT